MFVVTVDSFVLMLVIIKLNLVSMVVHKRLALLLKMHRQAENMHVCTCRYGTTRTSCNTVTDPACPISGCIM